MPIFTQRNRATKPLAEISIEQPMKKIIPLTFTIELVENEIESLNVESENFLRKFENKINSYSTKIKEIKIRNEEIQQSVAHLNNIIEDNTDPVTKHFPGIFVFIPINF